MRNLILMMVLCSFLGCNSAQENAQDALTSSMEKTIEARTGTKVDLGDASSYADNNGSVSLVANDKTYLRKEEKLQAVAIFQKDHEGLAISFQLTGEAGKSLIAIISHIPEDFSMPLTAKFAVSNSFDGVNPVATLMLMETNENGVMTSPVPFEGTLTITKLTAKEMTFEVAAKGGTAVDADSPSAWKPIVATGILHTPIIQSIGIDKKDVLK